MIRPAGVRLRDETGAAVRNGNLSRRRPGKSLGSRPRCPAGAPTSSAAPTRHGYSLAERAGVGRPPAQAAQGTRRTIRGRRPPDGFLHAGGGADMRISIVCDNYSPHLTITALRYFALAGTDHASHKEQGSMIRRYIIWRNKNAADQRLREVVTRANVA
ncbi:hypothetical protein [Kitasatospora sp. NPDC004531]